MRNHLLILLFLSVVLGNVFAQDTQLKIAKVPLTKYFEPEDYQGGIQNWSFAQDTSGILFIANNFGLMEFNGGDWFNYQIPNSTKLRSVHIGKDNRIYVGGQGQIGYFIEKIDGYEFVSLLDRLPENKRQITEVWKIIELNEVLYFNTSNRLLVFENNHFSEIHLPHQIQRAFKVNSSIMVQFQEKGLYELKDKEFKQVPRTLEVVDDIIAIIEESNGFVCFTTHGQTFRYHAGTFQRISTGLDGLAKPVTINTAALLSSGQIAIGTQNDGLFILNQELNIEQNLTKNKGLHNRTVHSVLEDDFKNLWVGLNNGINYLELSSPLSLINEEVGLEGTGYAAIVHKNEVYLGTNNGLFVNQGPDNDQADYTLFPGSEGQVYSLSAVEDDLILNHHRGRFEIKNNELIRFHDTGSWNFLPTSKPGLMVGGDYNGINFFMKQSGSWKLTKAVEYIKESSRVMVFENDSTLWMTHGYKGAYLIHFTNDLQTTKRIGFYGAKNGLPSNILISVYELGESRIFAAEQDIFNFNMESQEFTPNEFLIEWLGSDHVSNITTGDNGDIFYIADRELGYLRQESFGMYTKEQNVFKRINKFASDYLENITILDEHNVLIGAKEGFIHLDPLKKFEIVEDYNVALRSAEVKFLEDSSATIMGNFLSNAKIIKNTSIKFQFATPYFDGFEDIRYSQRLIGFDTLWSEWSPETSKEYTNLPAGKFTFEVKARNIYESESKVSAYPFSILHKWYESNWAYAGFIALAILTFALTSFFQSKKHKKEKEKLYLSKEEAIKSKDEELFQFSKETKEEIKNLRNEKFRSEINHKNNELASATMHLLNKNEFVQGVRKRIELIINENGNSKEELKRILKTIDKNLKDDDSWDQFAHYFDQVHGDFLSKLSNEEIKLTPQETKLAAYLRVNMSSKEIANLMNISVRGVELARYRLRKKFKLNRDQNLIEYLLHL